MQHRLGIHSGADAQQAEVVDRQLQWRHQAGVSHCTETRLSNPGQVNGSV